MRRNWLGPAVCAAAVVVTLSPLLSTPAAAGDLNWYLGAMFNKSNLEMDSQEFLRNTGQRTFKSIDYYDPLGVGVVVGAKFNPFNNSVVVSPFASFEYLGMSIYHYFPGGSYFGTTSNFDGTLGVKIGPEIGPGLWLYGIAGVSALNETLKINFIPFYSSTTTTVAGGMLGVGGAFKPSFLQTFGLPISLFAEYHHTWWQDGHYDAPAASPLFNYTFKRQDDAIKVGFMVEFGASPAVTPAPAYPVKALPPK